MPRTLTTSTDNLERDMGVPLSVGEQDHQQDLLGWDDARRVLMVGDCQLVEFVTEGVLRPAVKLAESPKCCLFLVADLRRLASEIHTQKTRSVAALNVCDDLDEIAETLPDGPRAAIMVRVAMLRQAAEDLF